MKRVALLLLLACGVAAPASGIDFSGTCTGTVPAAGSPHRLVGACTVPAAGTFTIEAGAVLDGQLNSLLVDGDLDVVDAELDDLFVNARSGADVEIEDSSIAGGNVRFSAGSAGSVKGSAFATNQSCALNVTDASPTIEENTFAGTFRAICVDGNSAVTPAMPTITGNQITVRSAGVQYGGNTSGGTLSGNTFGFSGTASGRIAIDVDGGAAPQVSGNTILDDPARSDTAVRIDPTPASTVRIENNAICATGEDVPVGLGINFFAAGSPAVVQNNTFGCDPGVPFGLFGTLAANGTLRAVEGRTRYRQSGAVFIGDATDFVLPAGFAIDGANSAFAVDGSLTADGCDLTGSFLSVRNGGTLNLDDVDYDGGFVSFSAGSAGSVSGSRFSSTQSCAISITDASPAIAGNSFTDTFRALCVGGNSTTTPAMPAVTGNQFTVSFLAVQYGTGTSGGTMSGNTIAFTGTSNGRVGITVDGAASPVLTGNTILDDPARIDTGIRLSVTAASTVRVEDNDICSTGGDTPIELGTAFFTATSTAVVQGNDFSCGPGTGLTLFGAIDAAGTLRVVEGQTSYRQSGSVFVGGTFVVPAGFAIDGRGNALLVDGAFEAADVALSDVFLTARSGGSLELERIDMMGGTITFGAGSTGNLTDSTLTSNQGCAVSVADASPTIEGNSITDVVRAICVSGSSTTAPAMPAITGNDLSATFNPILFSSGTSGGTVGANIIGFSGTGSGRAAVQINGSASPVVSGNTFLDDPTRSDSAVRLDPSVASTARVEDNDICATGNDFPIELGLGIFANTSAAVVAGNDLSCGLGAGIAIFGSLDHDGTLDAVEGQTRYVQSGTMVVGADARFVVPAGFAIDSASGSFLIDGALEASGSALARMFLTARSGSTLALADIDLEGSSVNFASGSGGSVRRSRFTTTQSCALSITDASPMIEANTFSGPFRAVCIGGSSTTAPAMPVIADNDLSVAFNGLTYSNGTAAGAANGNTIRFIGTGGSRVAIAIDGAASPLVTGNTIVDDPQRSDVGVRLDPSPASLARVENNDICATAGDVPIDLGIGYFADACAANVADNDFRCGRGAGLTLFGAFTGTGTLAAVEGQSRYRLSGGLFVQPGADLLAPAGFTIDGANSSVFVDGRLRGEDIVIRAAFLNARDGGVLDLDGAALSGGSLTYAAGSTGAVRDSSFEGISGTAVSVRNATPTFTGSTFTGMTLAIDLTGTSDVLIEDNTFRSTTTAIAINGPEVLSRVRVNRFDSNSRSLGFTDAATLFGAFPAEFSTNAFFGEANLIRLPFAIGVSGTLPAAPVAYFAGGMDIRAGAELTIGAGTAIRTGGFQEIAVQPGSRIAVSGTPAAPVVFTAENAKSGSRWNGLRIAGDGSTLDGCVVEFSRAAGLTLEDASVPIGNCRISDNASHGVLVTGTSAPEIGRSAILSNFGDGVRFDADSSPLPAIPSVEDGTIFGNSGAGINQLAGGFIVAAERNYWGDDTGPSDLVDDRAGGGLFNPAGLGQTVGSLVDYDPFIRIGPSLAGKIVPVGGDGQSGPVGSTLPEPIVVEVRSTLGSPLSGVDVIFSVVEGDAEVVEPQPTRTGANGRAAARVMLGLTPGAVRLAVTARDVASPLATFAGEADALTLSARALRIRAARHGSPRPGDVNDDSRIDLLDAALIRAVVDGAVAEDSSLVPAFAAADLNRDGRIDTGDVRAVLGVQLGSIAPGGRNARRSAGDSRPAAGGMPAHIELPAAAFEPGDVVEVPIFLAEHDARAYALRLRYNRRVLRLTEVLGGTADGFTHPPLTNTRASGRVDFAAVRDGAGEAVAPHQVARVRFQVIGRVGERTRLRLSPMRGGGVVDGADFTSHRARAARATSLAIVEPAT